MLTVVIEKMLGWLADAFVHRRRVRFTVHLAGFVGSSRPAFFLNVVNLSHSREIEISHVWIASEPPVAASRSDRPLPRRLKPDEAWETWVYADAIPPSAYPRITGLGRLRLSTGAVIKSRPNRSVPPAEGAVPGGAIRDFG